MVGQFMAGVRQAMTWFVPMAPQKRRQARAAYKAQRARPAHVEIREVQAPVVALLSPSFVHRNTCMVW